MSLLGMSNGVEEVEIPDEYVVRNIYGEKAMKKTLLVLVGLSRSTRWKSTRTRRQSRRRRIWNYIVEYVNMDYNGLVDWFCSYGGNYGLEQTKPST